MKMITCMFITAVDVSFPLVEKDLSIPEPPTVVSAAQASHRSKRGFGSITIAGQTSKILKASLLLLLSSFHFYCPFLPPALHFPPTFSSSFHTYPCLSFRDAQIQLFLPKIPIMILQLRVSADTDIPIRFRAL